jgi:predicted nucleic acid-binding protein
VILVDTNVVLDVLSDDDHWRTWSKARLISAARQDGLAINDIVYAELSIGYDDLAELEALLEEWKLQLLPIPRLALFQAGKAFRRYRQSGGIRTGVLPDFFIGAHALVEGRSLLTRDPARIKTYFPTVTLITP